jgi:hypothetical protein
MDDVSEITRVMNEAGWKIGHASFVDPMGKWVWIVTGSHGAHRVRAEALSELAAWQSALKQARALGLAGSSSES